MPSLKKKVVYGDNARGEEWVFTGEQNEWTAKAIFEDDVPVALHLYLWDVSGENKQRGIDEIIGPDYKLGTAYGGNGHESYDIVRKEKP